QFDWGFIFKYSTREGTPAANLVCLPQEVIEERHQRCLELVDRIAFEKRCSLSGTVQDVLVEEDKFGRTRTNHKLRIEPDCEAGDRGRVGITNTQRATLQGELENGDITFENFRQENGNCSRPRA